MSYRTRVALVIGGLCALAIFVVAVAASLIASHVMYQAVDNSLQRRVTLANQFDLTTSEAVTSRIVDDYSGTGPLVQIINAEGDVSFAAAFDPAEAEVAIATGVSHRSIYRFANVNGRRIRILTAPHVSGGAVQVGEDVADLDVGLRRLRLLLIPTGVLTSVVVGLLAWWRSRRLIRPLESIADAATAISQRAHPEVTITSPGGAELDRLASSFNEMSRALRMAKAQQHQLVGDLGHDLRTPLTGLRVKAEFLQGAPDLPRGQRVLLNNRVVADVVALDAMVHDLLDLARGDAVADPERFDIGLLVATEVDRFRVATGRDATVEADVHEILGYPRLIGRALANLLDNARLYDLSGQPIAVTHRVEHGISLIEVRDRGPGIPAEERAAVLQRGGRGSTSLTVDGSGIGLAVAAHAASVHGGRTWIDDRPGGGASIGLSLRSLPC